MKRICLGLGILFCSISAWSATGIDDLTDAQFKELYADPDNATCTWVYSRAPYEAVEKGMSQASVEKMKAYCKEAQADMDEVGKKMGLNKSVRMTASLKYNHPDWQQKYKSLFPDWEKQVNKRLAEVGG